MWVTASPPVREVWFILSRSRGQIWGADAVAAQQHSQVRQH